MLDGLLTQGFRILVEFKESCSFPRRSLCEVRATDKCTLCELVG